MTLPSTSTPNRNEKRDSEREKESAESLWLKEKRKAEEALAKIEQENIAKFKKMMERKQQEEEQDRLWSKDIEDRRKREEERAVEKEERDLRGVRDAAVRQNIDYQKEFALQYQIYLNLCERQEREEREREEQKKKVEK